MFTDIHPDWDPQVSQSPGRMLWQLWGTGTMVVGPSHHGVGISWSVSVSVCECEWRRRGIGMQLIGAGLSNDLRENPSIP